MRFLKILFGILSLAILGVAVESAATRLLDGPALRAYQKLSAQEKQDKLFNEGITPSRYTTLPPFPSLSPLKLLEAIPTLYKTFDTVSDELPLNRAKIIHPFGSVAKIEFIPAASSPYSGIYESGAIGLARLSLAANPADASYTPGMALKFLIDGEASRNIVVMYSLDGQGDNHNFFENDFTNILPDPVGNGLKIGGLIFKTADKNPTQLRVSHFAGIDRKGNKIAAANRRFPFQLILKPNQKEVRISAKSKSDFRAELAKIAPDTEIYSVYAKETNEEGSPEEYIGKIVTRSKMIASQYGDETLFFEHFHLPSDIPGIGRVIRGSDDEQ